MFSFNKLCPSVLQSSLCQCLVSQCLVFGSRRLITYRKLSNTEKKVTGYLQYGNTLNDFYKWRRDCSVQVSIVLDNCCGPLEYLINLISRYWLEQQHDGALFRIICISRM